MPPSLGVSILFQLPLGFLGFLWVMVGYHKVDILLSLFAVAHLTTSYREVPNGFKSRHPPHQVLHFRRVDSPPDRFVSIRVGFSCDMVRCVDLPYDVVHFANIKGIKRSTHRL